jgi:uroporphyrinogen decarboxylase
MVDAETKLSSRERVIRMFERRDHDRVPRHDTWWRETIERWQREGLDGDGDTILNFLGNDFYAIAGSWPVPFRGQSRVVSEDAETRTTENEWGEIVRYWKNRSGTPEHLGWGCGTREAWEKRYKPIYQNLDVGSDTVDILGRYKAGRAAGGWCYLTALESFESTRHLMGDMGSMIGMVEDPEWVIDVSRVYTDAVIRGLDKLMATGIQPDGLWIYGDMAYKNATMCSPQMYRDIIWPDHKRLADWGHAHGMKVIFHTDGNVNGVIDLYIEAGIDCLQPLEAKAGMDIRSLGPKYGSRLAFFGNIDAMVLGTNDRAKIEHEVRTKLEAGKATRGYAYHSDHSVPPTVSWQTYQYVIELLDQWGTYT